MRSLTAILLFIGCGTLALAQDPDVQGGTAKSKTQLTQKELFEQFSGLLKKSVMVGTFMIDGDEENRRREERYEISKVVKNEEGDYWSFFARIKYGTHDVTLPIPVEVKWAGETPVITVDNLTIPGLGTFDSRVVISDNKYAGTWRHGTVGGLMFGHIEKQTPPASKNDSTAPDDAKAE